MAFSPAAYALFGLLLYASIALARTILNGVRNPLNKVPGPLYALFTNLPLKLSVITGRRVHFVHTLHLKYGPYVRIAPDEVAVNSIQGFRQIHGIGNGFTKSPWYQDMVLTDRPGVFSMTDPKRHAARRKLFARPFSKTHIREHWEPAVRERIELAVSSMRKEAASTMGGCIVDVMKWWTFMASDVSSKLMFGECFHTLERGEVSDYMRVLANVLKGAGIGAELPVVRQVGKMLPFQAAQEFFGGNEFLDAYGKTAVKNMKASGSSSRNIFANIMAEAEKGERLDDRDVELEAMGLIVAGTDTTAFSLTYLIYAVLSRPRLQQQLEDEVAALPEGYRDADLEALPLLSAVIEETLRLYGAAPGMLPRMVPSGGIDLDGHFLPDGTTATTHSYCLHRDPNLYPEPEEFNVSRWLASTSADDKYRLSEAGKHAFSPFGGGSRSCLGVHLAYMELRLSAAEFFRVCRGARLAPSATAACMEMENYFIISPAGHKCEVILKQ
ncbi:Uu.00g068910.m01.CDS01 [Anthostomella pinea]|uniref:Uu.00g068910.m01.CDS01 n=1 Tax=Anthostomella pinea TaxID=933095 RepID=A0AAI8VUF7_9PEZI|nr:Uu.00g068910.m01.CDS01 [Anthostomella pinea]